MGKILVLIPHGEIHGRDDVRAYHWQDIERNLTRYYNMGDLFVYDSSLKVLDFDEIEPLTISQVSPYDIDRCNAEFDYCFLRGSNYLHAEMQWECAEEVLSKLKIPVIPFGIGAQAPEDAPPRLSEQTMRVMRRMGDSCARVGVRGTFSAEVLNGIGVKNIEIVGCPTLFRARDSNLAIAVRSDAEAVGFGLRREADAHYVSDLARYHGLQRRIIEDLDKRYSLTVLAQGEMEEKQIFYRSAEHLPAAVHNLVATGWFQSERDPLYALYRNQLFFSEHVSDYEALMQRFDLVVTFRLHAALLALANGTPAIFCTYDSRSRELAETFAIPGFDMRERRAFVLEDYHTQQAFDRFNAAYRRGYDVMRGFLDANGMAHRLPAPEGAAA